MADRHRSCGQPDPLRVVGCRGSTTVSSGSSSLTNAKRPGTSSSCPTGWCRDGHALVLDDLADVLVELPAHLVVGTGADGRPSSHLLTCGAGKVDPVATTPTSVRTADRPAAKPLSGPAAAGGIPSVRDGRWPVHVNATVERIPVGGLSAYPRPLRSSVTWGKGGPHSGYRHLADKTRMACGRHDG